MILQFSVNGLEHFITILLYDFQNHSGQGVQLEGSQFVLQKFFLRERDETFKNTKTYEDKTQCPALKYWRLFLKNAFHGGNTFWANLRGVVLHEGLMIKPCQGENECFTNVFSNNLKVINLKIFPDLGGTHTRR